MSRFHMVNLVTLVLVAGAWVLSLPPTLAWAAIAGNLVLFQWGIVDQRLEYFCPCAWRGTGQGLALTFDDGPDPESTPALLDLLRRHQVRAAFFCVGAKVHANPAIARRIVEEGHLIGNHTLSHRMDTNFLCGRALQRELSLGQRAIRRAVGRTPRLFRAPMGLTQPALRPALAATQLILIGWRFRALDQGRSTERITARVNRLARPGDVLILHDGSARTGVLIPAVERIILHQRRQGREFVRLDELLGLEPYRGISVCGQQAVKPGV